ncbi:GPI transamidase component [Microbotryomycetes sp. JL221]|nr:GPI transamidase component [Microbotryomycetes sp. JL221]
MARVTVPSTEASATPHIVAAAADLLNLRASQTDHRVVNFAPKYKVVFSLLNEDSTKGSSVLDWPAAALLSRHIVPMLREMTPLFDFDVETSIQHFAPLTVPITRDEATGGTAIQVDDLRAFVNNADWNLPVSIALDPVLHFVLFVPSSANRPMRINATNGVNAFITPQRGGVVLFNPSSPSDVDLNLNSFDHAFELFRQQLRKILGVPATHSAAHSPRVLLDDWQVDAMIRSRLAESVKSCVGTLAAIAQLVSDISNLRVGKQVQTRVQQAIAELEQTSSYLDTPLNVSSHRLALQHAAKANTLASAAYFDPSMLALLYFPDEHKYAIYTPLFGPVAVPLVVILLKELKAWRDRRRKSATAGERSRVKQD